MANIKPFRAVRPENKYIKMVSELPYDIINRAQRDINEDIDQVFFKDKQDAIYIYRQIVNNRAQIGIIACVAVDDNINGVVKKNKYSKLNEEIEEINYTKSYDISTGAILLTYKEQEEIAKIIDYYVYFITPIYDFKTEDGVIHSIWKVEKERDIEDLVNEFYKVKNLYVAGGYDTCKLAENKALEERRKNQNYTGKEQFNYYVAMIATHTNTNFMDYNRVVKYLNGFN